MSNTKHTKGTWSIKPEEAHRNYIRIRGDRLGARYKIANVDVSNYDGVSDCDVEESRANARLIASAPFLFETLEAIKGMCECAYHQEGEFNVKRLEELSNSAIKSVVGKAE